MSVSIERAYELLAYSLERMELALYYYEQLGSPSSERLVELARSERDVNAFPLYDTLVHQIDLSTEGLRQLRESGTDDVLALITARVNADFAEAYMGLHSQYFHQYLTLKPSLVANLLAEDVPIMAEAVREVLQELQHRM